MISLPTGLMLIILPILRKETKEGKRKRKREKKV